MTIGLLAGLASHCFVFFSDAHSETPEDRVIERVGALADPRLEGRAPGSPGLATAKERVVEWLEQIGLEPARTDGSWFQSFRVADLPPGVAPRAEGIHLATGTTWDDVELSNIVAVLPAAGSGPAAGSPTGASSPAGAHSLDDAAGSSAGTGSGRLPEGASPAASSGPPCVVLGAHLDHLGKGEDGGVFAGADDNASGVVALVEAARQLKSDGPFARDIVFVIFDGEEAGQLGSYYYVKNPVRPMATVEAMINLDTVGRMDGRALFALGSGTAIELEEALRGVNLAYGFELALPEKGPFASDQVPFFEAGVPVVHLTTGANPDYHRVSDTADKIATDELVELSQFTAELVAYLADREGGLTFVPPGASEAGKMAPAAGAAPRRVSLGTIPDFSRESGGVLLSGVMAGSPAEEAGLRKGDVLVEMDGTPVDNLGDFSGILKTHEPGDEVGVVVLRGDARIETTVTLVERK